MTRSGSNGCEGRRGEETTGTQAARTPGETRGDKRPPSIPGAFASGYPSPMRSAAHNPTIMT